MPKHVLAAGLAAVTLLLPACARDGAGTVVAAPPSSCPEAQLVAHSLGTTCVPERAARVVTLDWVPVDTMMALGLDPPVGSTKDNQVPAHVRGYLTPSEVIGLRAQPDLERIAALEPDLILAVDDFEPDLYDELSAIAPTVVPVYSTEEDGVRWQEIHRTFSAALGMPAAADTAIDAFEQRLDDFRRAMGPRLDQIQVSLLSANADGTVELKQPGGPAANLVQRAGIAQTPPPGGSDETSVVVSMEEIATVDADHIFVYTFVTKGGQDRDARLSSVRDNPLFARLDAARSGNVHLVGEHWYTTGPTAANLVLDDLVAHLVE